MTQGLKFLQREGPPAPVGGWIVPPREAISLSWEVRYKLACQRQPSCSLENYSVLFYPNVLTQSGLPAQVLSPNRLGCLLKIQIPTLNPRPEKSVFSTNTRVWADSSFNPHHFAEKFGVGLFVVVTDPLAFSLLKHILPACCRFPRCAANFQLCPLKQIFLFFFINIHLCGAPGQLNCRLRLRS